MRKTYYALMLFFALTIGVVGCGGSKKTNQTNTKDSTSTSGKQSGESRESSSLGDQGDSGNNETSQKMSEVIQSYCDKFNEGKYLEVESLFAPEVSQYISMKNTKAAVIAKEVNRFLTKKSDIDYAADLDELKVNGKTATVPLNIKWSGYQTRVLTEVTFDDAYKITSLKETKVLKQKYTQKLQTSKKQVVKSYKKCDHKSKKNNCTYLLFDYMLVDSAPSKEVKNLINNKVISILTAMAGTESTDESMLQKEANNFVTGYAEARKDGIDNTAGAWYMNHQVIVKETGNIATVEYFMDGYGGGAHGVSAVKVVHFDMSTGKEVTLVEMLTDNYLPELKKIATKILRKQNDIPEGKSISEYGYDGMNDNEKFVFAKGYTFKGDRIEFLYGRYEVGPYVMVPPMLSIKYADIKHLIKMGLPH